MGSSKLRRRDGSSGLKAEYYRRLYKGWIFLDSEETRKYQDLSREVICKQIGMKEILLQTRTAFNI